MNYLGKVINNCKYIYNEINAATLTGAIDVVVVEQPDGTFTCSPFHVRFGKIGVLRSKEKVVDIEINGEPVDIHMKLGESGEAFFVEEVGEGEGEDFIPPHLACSPIPPDGDRFLQSDWQRLEECDTENPPDESAMTTGNQTPKTFKAETVDELNDGPTRKLSTTEFRPISGQTLDESPPKENTDFVKEDSPSADETNTVTVSKRKRRKKSIKKKHGNNVQKRNSIPSVPMAEVKIEEQKQSSNDAIFQMEDLDSSVNETEHKMVEIIKEEPESSMELPTVQELPVERDIHFFSDTEITPGSSPRDDRDFAPVQSDSEFETKRLTGVGSEGVPNGTGEDHAQSWRWGELPTPEPEDKKQESQKWMHSMLGFMKKTKHMRHKNENEGIYLSEVNSEDPEMAALYFPNSYKQPTPAPTQDFAEPTREEDAESGNGPSLPQSPHSVEGAICGPKWNPEDIALSLCGTDGADTFDEHIVSFSDLVSDPGVVNNPKLIIRMDGKVYPWRTAAPLVMALFVFHKPLPQEVVARITGDLETEVSKQEKEKQQKKIHYSSWFNWSRINEEQKFVGDENGTPVKDEERTLPPKETVANKSMDSNEGDLKEELAQQSTNTYEKYRKTLRLSSQQIAKLKLQPGANEIEFSVTTAYQGTSRCKCSLFCWRYDDQIVVSDIDGTITKSDVLGHILPIVGKDWAQSGVAKLFTKIKENGYKLLYLSARAIGQSRVTREYLKSIKQEDLTLPEGPVLLNPTSLLNAFHTEVIEKKPEEFKISCLRDIQALFPPHIKPFYAGYGNKINDVWAYQAVGIPIFRIFTINHKGELKHELTQTFQSTSYLGQSSIVNDLFPPMVHSTSPPASRPIQIDTLKVPSFALQGFA